MRGNGVTEGVESRITGVTAQADERQRSSDGETLGSKKKEIKSVQQDEDLLVHSRPDPSDLAICPAVCSNHPPTSGSASMWERGQKLQILTFNLDLLGSKEEVLHPTDA